jgi:hypothetical protein
MSEDQRPPDDPEPTRLESGGLQGRSGNTTRQRSPSRDSSLWCNLCQIEMRQHIVQENAVDV